jgi:hypothetical protein
VGFNRHAISVEFSDVPVSLRGTEKIDEIISNGRDKAALREAS